MDATQGGALQVLDRPLREGSAADDPLPAALARFALRTGEAIVLDDAQAPGGAFAQDAWVRARRTRSLLALPLSRQGRVLGVLVLDNDLTTAAFTSERLHALRVLATQAAIREITETLCRLLAPMLAFTADEAWEHLGYTDSVHLQSFPQPNPAFPGSDATLAVNELLKVRGVIQQAIEKPVRKRRSAPTSKPPSS